MFGFVLGFFVAFGGPFVLQTVVGLIAAGARHDHKAFRARQPGKSSMLKPGLTFGVCVSVGGFAPGIRSIAWGGAEHAAETKPRKP